MKTRILQIAGTVGVALLPAFAFADTLSTSSAATIGTNMVSDLGGVLATVIPAILVVVVALLAIGMVVRYVKKHVSGRKF